MFHRSLGVQILILNKKGMVLLILRNDFPVWTLPGGRINKEEDTIKAAKRELSEETGLRAKNFSSRGIFLVKFFPFAGKTELFVAKKVTGKIKLSKETRSIKYFPVNKLPWNILPYLRKRIQQGIL